MWDVDSSRMDTPSVVDEPAVGAVHLHGFIRVPFDIFFTPIERDQEVWFGIVLRGMWAKVTEPLHWAVYAAGAWGFWKMRRWMWPWAAVYVAQVASAR